ncbi:hypothetical protein VSR82_38035 [Burkholderia sp. JPY481]|uniref:hypothetical protein n=1 Tax=Paraburkholderia sp. EG304 TaxID=3237015 RepID=UPI00317E14BB
MPTEWTSFVPNVITAVSGLAGVALGGFLTSNRELSRDAASNEKAANYLAILVVAHLDRFIDGCVNVVGDDGTSYGQPAGEGGVHEPTVDRPKFDPLAIDVDWKSLPADLMYPILNLPYQIETLEHRISNVSEFDNPPDHADTFWARQHDYALLGLEISSLATRLRNHANLPALPRLQSGLDRDRYLSEQKHQLEEKRSRYEAALQKANADLDDL